MLNNPVPGLYQALYERQVLFRIISPVGDLQRSTWVAAETSGSLVQPNLVELIAPELLDGGEGVRYRFGGWSEGETPSLPTNRVAPLAPKIVEVAWTTEYLVKIEGPEGIELSGTEWHEEGATLVLRAPNVQLGESGVDQLKFARWESIGRPAVDVPSATNPSTQITVAGPYTIRAVYDQQFFVKVRNPPGILFEEWVNDGKDLAIETLPVLDLVPGQVRLVFNRWDGLIGAIPSIVIKVDKPVELTAIYERQAMVTVVSPYGSYGGGWHPVGSVVTVSVPDSVQSRLVFKKSFKGFGDRVARDSSVELLVDGPVVITAIYSDSVNVGILALFLLLPLAAVLLFFGNRWVFLLIRRLG